MLTKRTWFAIIILGFLGSLAWGVENQFFNTFIYNTITPDPRPIAWMVAASAITATFASIFMGALSDRVRHRWGRKPFLLIGYIGWGITTALFPTAAFFHSIGLAIFLAITFDCVMTFFGSSANDSVFHAYVADITTTENRGKVMGVLEILTWVSLLIVYGGAGFIIDALGYFAFFYIIGGLVFVLGLVASLLLKEPPLPREAPKGSYFSQISETFRWTTLKNQRDLLLLLISITLWGIAQQIFFPYLMIYINTYLKIATLQASLIIFVAILIGGIATAYPLGLLTDRWGRKKVALLAVFAEMIGLIAFSMARTVPALMITGVLWLAPISAWTIATSAWSKDLFPEDKRAQFGGYVILFSVAFTMVPGPMIGSWLTTAFGVHTILKGQEAYIPTSLIFQVGGIATLLAAIPLLRIRKKIKSK
ncbi:MAG: MFS transporter [Chloroflexi bacterium]|nr:MFS transporter [Chloroflexota bacterium]